MTQQRFFFDSLTVKSNRPLARPASALAAGRDATATKLSAWTCGHQPTNGANWPKKGRDWYGGMEEAGADRLLRAMHRGGGLRSRAIGTTRYRDRDPRDRSARRRTLHETAQRAAVARPPRSRKLLRARILGKAWRFGPTVPM